MSSASDAPRRVPRATVRRLSSTRVEGPVPLQRLAVPPVPAASVLPRQIDRVGLRLLALEIENDHLRAAIDALRTA